MAAGQLTRLVDEVLDRADQAIGEVRGRARRELEQTKSETATAAKREGRRFDLLVGCCSTTRAPTTSCASGRGRPPARWAAAREQARQILRPVNDNHFEQLAARYSWDRPVELVRNFAVVACARVGYDRDQLEGRKVGRAPGPSAYGRAWRSSLPTIDAVEPVPSTPSSSSSGVP